MLSLGLAVVAALNAPPAVAIEPGDFDAPTNQRVIESCERALGRGRCVLATPSAVPAEPSAPAGTTDAAETPPPFRARLTWDGETLKVELFSSESAQLVAESNVLFAATDDEQQRWIAAGLLVASLAAAQASGELSAPLVEEPPPPPKEPPKPIAKPPAPPRKPVPEEPEYERLRLDWSIFAAPGFDEGPLRVGFGAAAEFLPKSLPTGARLSLRFADAAPNAAGAELSSLSGTVGFVTCLTDCHGSELLEVSAEVVGENTIVRVVREGESQRQTALRYGGRFGLTFTHRVTEGIGVFIGGDVTGLSPELAVRVDSKAGGEESSWRWAISAGARIFVPGT